MKPPKATSRVVCLVWAAVLCAAPQAPRDPAPRTRGERVWFVRLSREDLHLRLRKGVASEGAGRFAERLSAEIAAALAETGGRCVWVDPGPLVPQARVVAIGAGGGEPREAVDKKLKSVRFRVEWLEVTGIDVEKAGVWRFHEIGGVFCGPTDNVGRYLVPHLPEVKPERLLAVVGRAGGGRIRWDPILLEVVSGDPGVGGIKIQRALDGVCGVRIVPPAANATRFTVEVEMSAMPEMVLRADVPKGKFIGVRDLGAPSTRVVERLRKAGIEAREVR